MEAHPFLRISCVHPSTCRQVRRAGRQDRFGFFGSIHSVFRTCFYYRCVELDPWKRNHFFLIYNFTNHLYVLGSEVNDTILDTEMIRLSKEVCNINSYHLISSSVMKTQMPLSTMSSDKSSPESRTTVTGMIPSLVLEYNVAFKFVEFFRSSIISMPWDIHLF